MADVRSDPQPIWLQDAVSFNFISMLTSAPVGTELGLVTRNVPSGTQTVAGTVTANQGTAAALSGAWPVEVTDGTNVLGTSSHPLRIDPTGTTTQPTDPIDRAARLVGVVYGSQGQQLKQTATNFNLQTELATGSTLYDARQIRTLTSSDTVTAVQGTSAALSGAWPVKVTDGTNTMPTMDVVGRAGFQKITDGTNVASVTAKGTQGSEAINTQDYKDSGRTYVVLSALAIASVSTEALVTFTSNKGGTNTTGITEYTVTAAKTFRIQCVVWSPTLTTGTADVILRVRAAATVTASSPVLAAADYRVTTGTMQTIVIPIPDGLEVAAGQQIGISHGGGTGATETITLIGYEY